MDIINTRIAFTIAGSRVCLNRPCVGVLQSILPMINALPSIDQKTAKHPITLLLARPQSPLISKHRQRVSVRRLVPYRLAILTQDRGINTQVCPSHDRCQRHRLPGRECIRGWILPRGTLDFVGGPVVVAPGWFPWHPCMTGVIHPYTHKPLFKPRKKDAEPRKKDVMRRSRNPGKRTWPDHFCTSSHAAGPPMKVKYPSNWYDCDK